MHPNHAEFHFAGEVYKAGDHEKYSEKYSLESGGPAGSLGCEGLSEHEEYMALAHFPWPIGLPKLFTSHSWNAELASPPTHCGPKGGPEKT